MAITEVRIWQDTKTSEWRIYGTRDDGKAGCLYLTGNRWHPAKSTEGGLTIEDWSEARNLSVQEGKWHPYKATATAQTNGLRTNKRPGYCAVCGHTVPTGQGHIWQDQDSDEWMVAHNDATLCTHNREESVKAGQTQAERKMALATESEKLIADVAASTGLKRQDDWSWDDFAFSLGQVLVETEHFEAREYRQSDAVVGFVVKEKK